MLAVLRKTCVSERLCLIVIPTECTQVQKLRNCLKQCTDVQGLTEIHQRKLYTLKAHSVVCLHFNVQSVLRMHETAQPWKTCVVGVKMSYFVNIVHYQSQK